jgi:hypothetical protein
MVACGDREDICRFCVCCLPDGKATHAETAKKDLYRGFASWLELRRGPIMQFHKIIGMAEQAPRADHAVSQNKADDEIGLCAARASSRIYCNF